MQAVIVDGLDRVWALDTGRPEVNGSYLLAAVPGGPKIVGFYLNGSDAFVSAVEKGATEVVFAYSIMFQEGFEFNMGGKIPGGCTFTCFVFICAHLMSGCSSWRYRQRSLRLLWRTPR